MENCWRDVTEQRFIFLCKLLKRHICLTSLMRGRAEQVERIVNNLEKMSGVSFYIRRQF